MFGYEKSIQVLSWLLNKYNGVAYKITLIKLVYFADKYHLRKYGRTITGDTYNAMRFGPVARNTLNIADLREDWLPISALEMATKYIEKVDSSTLKSLEYTDTDALSESDIEALNFAFNKFGNYERFALAELTHKYPEWAKHQSDLENENNPIKSKKMDLEDFLLDAPKDLDPCYEMSEADKVFVKNSLQKDKEFMQFIAK